MSNRPPLRPTPGEKNCRKGASSAKPDQTANSGSRRDFIKDSSILVAGGVAGGMTAGQVDVARAANRSGSDEIRIGLIGCGARGTKAAIEALNTDGQVRLVSMGDVFYDRIQRSYRGIKGFNGPNQCRVDVLPEHKFVGLDAYQQVLQTDVDLVILATPPGFRPMHFEAAVKKSKHVFMEKPIATDAPGVRRVLAANAMARQKRLSVAVGLQRRHESRYIEVIRQLHAGAIGDINLIRTYWNGAGAWGRARGEGQTELEYQLRNWYYFNWLSGDHITEQHVHNIDIANWIKNDHPVSAQGQGGREVRTGSENGQIFDHHFIEFTYADGSKMFSQCRHMKNCWNQIDEHAHGSKGHAHLGKGRIFSAQGDLIFEAPGTSGHQQQQHDLFAAIRGGDTVNEVDYAAQSTMTAILGRMCSYSGKEISWQQAFNSPLTLANYDSIASLDDQPPVMPDERGNYPVAVPGKSWKQVL